MVVDTSTTFAIQPPGANVTWSVECLQGDAQNFGAINGTGRYYAPESSVTELPFTRVRVTATDMDSNYRSSALVTIVTNPITLNPLIEVCAPGRRWNCRQVRSARKNCTGRSRIRWLAKAVFWSPANWLMVIIVTSLNQTWPAKTMYWIR